MKHAIVMLVAVLGGCAMAPRERLTFPARPIAVEAAAQWYDVDRNGVRDFGVAQDNDGRTDRLLYDDDEDGVTDRIYRLADYANDDVPHVVLLLDSVPFRLMAERYGGGDFRFFDAPQKMVAPFPSLTEVCYTEVLGVPPLQTVIDTQYDPRLRTHRSDAWRRVVDGYRQPWEERLTYGMTYGEQGLSFLDPHAWYAAELSRIRRAIDESPDRTTIVYAASAASLVCKDGRAGANDVLDGAQQLCLQLLYERRGAIKISMMADHGHNFLRSKNVVLDEWLAADGFNVTTAIHTPDDVVISVNGLVTNALLHTARPAAVATTLCRQEAIELATYMSGDRVIIRHAAGTAAIEGRAGKFRYVPIDADVLHYTTVIRSMQASGQADADGFADEHAWFRATLDHEWPSAPPRVWAAFHRQFATPPSVMLSIKDGYYCGKPEYERFIDMQSTHGGLNQANCATFVMTMTGRIQGPVLHREVMGLLEPRERPRVVR